MRKGSAFFQSWLHPQAAAFSSVDSPDLAIAYYNLGLAFQEKLKDANDAIKNYNLFLKYAGNDPVLKSWLEKAEKALAKLNAEK